MIYCKINRRIPVEIEKVEGVIACEVAKYFRQKKMRLRDDASDELMRQVILFGERAAIFEKFRGELRTTGIFVGQDGVKIFLTRVLALDEYYATYRQFAHRLVIPLLQLLNLLLENIRVLAARV